MTDFVVLRILREFNGGNLEVTVSFSEIQDLLRASRCSQFSKELRRICDETRSVVIYDLEKGSYTFSKFSGRLTEDNFFKTTKQ